jgi:hypothetical protein
MLGFFVFLVKLSLSLHFITIVNMITIDQLKNLQEREQTLRRCL